MKEKLCDDVGQIHDNLAIIEEAMQKACLSAGRKRSDVTLMAVTKTVEPERINRALAEGITHIGENRVQEYLSKRDTLNLNGVKKHLIGHLQTNKVKQIVGLVDMIQSVDSIHLAQMISSISEKSGIMTDVLLEVNIGGELSKSGTDIEQLPALLEEAAVLPGIRVRGLMTIPPIFEAESEKRRVFSQMYKLFVDIRGKNIDNIDMSILSMGMSGDYVEAIQEGATLVRIGSALFGKRIYY